MSLDSSPTPLITFDLGGVIVRLAASLDEAAAVSGIRLREAAQPERDGELSLLFNDWQRGRVTDEQFFDTWTDTIGRFDRSEAPKLSLGWIVEEYDGMLQLVGDLKQAGVALGCLSNTVSLHWAYVLGDRAKFPSMQLIDHAHASHLIGAMKPEPAIYRAYEQLTGTAGSGIVFFDDLPENVQGARECGWRAYRVAPWSDPATQMRTALKQIGVLP
jgi:FMN phosphatase YigB (HAD superfamily)